MQTQGVLLFVVHKSNRSARLQVITAIVFTLVNTVLSAFMVFRALQLYLRMAHNRRKTSREDYRLLGKILCLSAWSDYVLDGVKLNLFSVRDSQPRSTGFVGHVECTRLFRIHNIR